MRDMRRKEKGKEKERGERMARKGKYEEKGGRGERKRGEGAMRPAENRGIGRGKKRGK